jgi:hypothetical protein
MQLLGKMLPLQVNADVAGAFISSVNIVSIPTDAYLNGPLGEPHQRPS